MAWIIALSKTLQYLNHINKARKFLHETKLTLSKLENSEANTLVLNCWYKLPDNPDYFVGNTLLLKSKSYEPADSTVF